MKYKVGDKVKIREDLVESEWYGCEYFSSDMKNFLGKVCTVSDVCKDAYILKEDEETWQWYWTDEMLEDYKEVDDNEQVSEQVRTVDVGFHLDYCGNRVLKDVWQGETGVNRLYYTKNYEIQYIIPINNIDFIIPHED